METMDINKLCYCSEGVRQMRVNERNSHQRQTWMIMIQEPGFRLPWMAFAIVGNKQLAFYNYRIKESNKPTHFINIFLGTSGRQATTIHRNLLYRFSMLSANHIGFLIGAS